MQQRKAQALTYLGSFSDSDLLETYAVGSLKSTIETVEKVIKYIQSYQ